VVSLQRPADVLETIVAATRRIVADRRERESATALETRAAARRPDGLGFRNALARPDRLNIIAECKRRSPSRGVLRQVYEPVPIAIGYADAGAAALSILTEPFHFAGSLDDLRARYRRVQLVFTGEAPDISFKTPGVMHVRRQGRVLTALSSAGSDALVEEAMRFGPVSADVLPVTLKEIFLESVAVED
jgi:hypothetical protein